MLLYLFITLLSLFLLFLLVYIIHINYFIFEMQIFYSYNLLVYKWLPGWAD